MRNQSHLFMLNNLAQQAVKKANKQLGTVQQSQRHAEQQLTLLLNYQDEYHLKLNNALTDGMTASSWQNYQQFIHMLEQAIDKHKQQLTQCTQKVEQSIAYWKKKRQQLNAYTTLQERAKSLQRQRENCLNQRLMDEFTQRHSYRSVIK
jgi:flagellar FliJ protein